MHKLDPDPQPGEVWLVKSDIGLPETRRIVLVTRVYSASTGMYPGAMHYRAIDGLMDGKLISNYGTGWLQERLF